MRLGAACVAAALLAPGCATEDQLRQSQAQQGAAVQALRENAGRSESSMADLRAELRRTQDTVHSLQIALTETRTRADAAQAQADTALTTTREFLNSLLAAREEQRRQLDESGLAFADLRRRATELETKLREQQQTLEQGSAAFDEVARRLAAMETGLQESSQRSMAMEARARSGQEADTVMTQQLASLRKQVEDTRAVMSSEGLLQMMRGLEDVRRSSASLRGSLDELQKAQSDVAGQMKNYYVDLDTRLRALKQQQAAARSAGVQDTNLPVVGQDAKTAPAVPDASEPAAGEAQPAEPQGGQASDSAAAADSTRLQDTQAPHPDPAAVPQPLQPVSQ
ncbi:MAG TPA: YbgF trimerization domain-containing protein [Burkholderiales bacterium]|nr:YbgF trimerization domain-containing protein [Burkholderiales bacterium]